MDTQNDEYNAILNQLTSFPNGATQTEIREALQWPVSYKRTLQRLLGTLVQDQRLIVEGKANRRRYRLPLTDNVRVAELSHDISVKDEIELSADSENIRTIIQQPVHLRVPVEYNRSFLDQYEPNRSFYLSESTRKQLFDIGNSNGDYPAGTYAKQILNRLLIDLSWNSSRLEGNTYTLLETERLLELNEIAEGKDLKDAQMILNHKEAIEFLVDSASEIKVDRRTILNLHAILSNDLLGDPQASGRLRTIPVGIAKSVYKPLNVPQRIVETFQQILDTAQIIKDPFEQAFFLMVHLPYLQPFEDVNKRVSRLAANIPLIINNLSPLSFVGMPIDAYVQGLLGVYELNRVDLLRDVFIWAYKRSCNLYAAKRRELGEPDPFRVRHRILIREAVTSIVLGQLDRQAAIDFIKTVAHKKVPKDEQAKFIEIVEGEILYLNEGNYARFKLRYSEFEAWRSKWK